MSRASRACGERATARLEAQSQRHVADAGHSAAQPANRRRHTIMITDQVLDQAVRSAASVRSVLASGSHWRSVAQHPVTPLSVVDQSVS